MSGEPPGKDASGSVGASGEGGPAGKAAPPGLPPASLSLLVAGIAAQVQVGLGLQKNPLSNTMTKSLDAAKHGIELLEILEAKTKGNLDARESALLGAVLFDLRMAYVEARRGGS